MVTTVGVVVEVKGKTKEKRKMVRWEKEWQSEEKNGEW